VHRHRTPLTGQKPPELIVGGVRVLKAQPAALVALHSLVSGDESQASR
jgi:hypothetical protein